MTPALESPPATDSPLAPSTLRPIMLTAKGEATVTVTDGQTVTLNAAFPSPPGSPLVGSLKGTAHELRVKVHGCKAIDPKATTKVYEIHGRWVSLTKDARDCLLK